MLSLAHALTQAMHGNARARHEAGTAVACRAAASHCKVIVQRKQCTSSRGTFNQRDIWQQVEIKTTKDTPDAGNLQKAADFVQAFILGAHQSPVGVMSTSFSQQRR